MDILMEEWSTSDYSYNHQSKIISSFYPTSYYGTFLSLLLCPELRRHYTFCYFDFPEDMPFESMVAKNGVGNSWYVIVWDGIKRYKFVVDL
ncbi:MAG: hypothetical protein GX234_11870 [Clostridiales bacterium]|nr:hypothetical protein [Clostridiales bacterium]